MLKEDFERATKFNAKSKFTVFDWIKKFVRSEILKTDVAIAGKGEEMALIDRSGKVIVKMTNS